MRLLTRLVCCHEGIQPVRQVLHVVRYWEENTGFYSVLHLLCKDSIVMCCHINQKTVVDLGYKVFRFKRAK